MKLTMQELMDAGVPRKTCLKIAREAWKVKSARIERELKIQREMGEQREYVAAMLQSDIVVTNEREMPRRKPRTVAKASDITLADGRKVSHDYFAPSKTREIVAHLDDAKIAQARGDRRRAA